MPSAKWQPFYVCLNVSNWLGAVHGMAELLVLFKGNASVRDGFASQSTINEEFGVS